MIKWFEMEKNLNLYDVHCNASVNQIINCTTSLLSVCLSLKLGLNPVSTLPQMGSLPGGCSEVSQQEKKCVYETSNTVTNHSRFVKIKPLGVTGMRLLSPLWSGGGALRKLIWPHLEPFLIQTHAGTWLVSPQSKQTEFSHYTLAPIQHGALQSMQGDQER